MSKGSIAHETDAQIVVAGSIEVRPEDQEQFFDVLRAHVPRVLHKEGCLAYSFSMDLVNTSVVRMSELWLDLPSLQKHLSSDEFQDTLKQLAGIEFLDRRVYRFEISEATAL